MTLHIFSSHVSGVLLCFFPSCFGLRKAPQINSSYFGGALAPPVKHQRHLYIFGPFIRRPKLGVYPTTTRTPVPFPPQPACRFAMQTASLHGSFRSRPGLRRAGFQAKRNVGRGAQGVIGAWENPTFKMTGSP